MEIRSSKLLKFNDIALFLEDGSRRCSEDVEEEFKCNNLEFLGHGKYFIYKIVNCSSSI